MTREEKGERLSETPFYGHRTHWALREGRGGGDQLLLTQRWLSFCYGSCGEFRRELKRVDDPEDEEQDSEEKGEGAAECD
jgi:hypothetical protein